MTLPYRPADPELCPTCGMLARWRCRCALAHRECPGGHEWHQCPQCNAVVSSPGDHAADTLDPANLCPTCRGAAHAR